MLSIANVSAAQAATYYQKDDYYTQGTQPDAQATAYWFGKGATTLGLSGPVDTATFQTLLEGHGPDGQALLAGRIDPKTHRAGTDFTFSAPKSVSIAALVQGDTRVLEAHRQAVAVALRVLEKRYAQTRVRRSRGKREHISTRNLVAAVFRHETSREQDPQLHSHCVVINTTQITDGFWRSFSNDAALAHQKLLGEIYQNELGFLLRQQGYELECRPNGQFELKGYAPDLLGSFSTRTQQIEAYLKQWETALADAGGKPLHASQRQQATLDTRKRKREVPRELLLEGWAQTIRDRGLTLPGVPTAREIPGVFAHKAAAIALGNGIDHAAERESVFRQAQVERFALEHALGQQSFENLQRAIETHESLIPVDGKPYCYTTQTAIERERDTIRRVQRGQGQVNPIADHEQVTSYLDTETSLTTGQQQAIMISATTSDQVIAWQGVAGAGKTYSLNLLAALAHDNGYTVKGFAPSAQAASVLSREARIPAETVARLLHSPQRVHPSDHEIWIVDEAGLLSAKDAYALLQRAEAERARVILVGDVRQLSAVEAGNPFRALQAAGIQTAHLVESRRQQTTALKTAVDLIAKGDMVQGLAALETAGMIREVAADERVQTLVEDYLALSPDEQQRTLLLSGTNAERLAVTAQLREAFQSTGRLGADRFTLQSLRTKDLTSAQAKYASHYAIGDVIVPQKHYPRWGLQRQQHYTVIGIEAAHNRLVLQSDNGETTAFNPRNATRKSCYTRQSLAISTGDLLRWTRNDRVLGVRNGQQFTVEAIDGTGQAVVRDQAGKAISLALSGQQFMDYAWVSTTFSSQGKTADRVLVAADATLNQETFYVAVSRARKHLTLYTDDPATLVKRVQRSATNLNVSDFLPLFQRITTHAQTQKETGRAHTDDHNHYRDIGRRLGERIASRIAAPLRRDLNPETAVKQLTQDPDLLETATLRSDFSSIRSPAGDARHPGPDKASQGLSTDSIRAISQQLAAAIRQRRERALKRRYRKLYERYRAQLKGYDPKTQDRIVVRQALMARLQRGGPRQLDHDDLVHAAKVVAQGETAQTLKQRHGKAVAIDYVHQLIQNIAEQLQPRQGPQQQRHRDIELER
ncbi:MAG: MobF family relaxase [Cyanobacteria bacterium P01_G01_bin.38]